MSTTSGNLCFTSKIDEMIQKSKEANKLLEKLSQKEVDKIVRELAFALYSNAETLAKMAVEETLMGNYEDKVIKNRMKSELICDNLNGVKTVGIINEDKANGIVEIAEPVGTVAAIIPSTNPSVTSMSNSMFAIKSRNSIICTPSKRAKKTTVETIKIMIEAAQKVGLPENSIQVIEEPSREFTQQLLAKADFIIATGGPGMVKAAYSSGKPSYGVGAGNVPAVIHSTADIPQAVSDIIKSKKFDNGLICSSEQTVIVTEDIAEKVLAEFREQNTYLLTEEEKNRLKKVMFPEGEHLSTEVVGQSAEKIASIAEITLPENNSGVILVPIDKIGKEDPFSGEKMSPVLAFYVASDFDEAVLAAKLILEYQGTGHSADIHTKDQDSIKKFALAVKASRILVNQPSSTNAGGSRTNNLVPTTTLGCGSWGGNVSSDNITAKHLLNIKRIAYKLDQTRDTSGAFNI